MAALGGGAVRLAQLEVSAEKVLYASPAGSAVVLRDLQPILPGHALVVPTRPVARLGELSQGELSDLVSSAVKAQELLQASHGAAAFNWQVKDGPASGAPVDHVHLHVVPRSAGDLEANDMVYDLIDRWAPVAGERAAPPLALEVPPDDARRPRTVEEMADEARRYSQQMGPEAGALPTAPVEFGKFKLDPSQVFYASPSGLSLAFVNLKPIVPGHVLVVPRRVVPKISELTAEELEDLFAAAQEVTSQVRRFYGASSATWGMQDGPVAGQSVPHVHVHVLPQGRGAVDAGASL